MKNNKNIKVRVIGRNIEVTPSLSETAEKHAAHIMKYCDDNSTITVTLSVKGVNHKADVMCLYRGKIMKVEKVSSDMYNTISTAYEVLERKLGRYHNRSLTRRDKASIKMPDVIPENDEDDIKIVKVKNFTIKPMSPEEACMQMDMLGHNFFVFRNAATGTTSVVYRRNDGEYGLIDPTID